MAQTKPITVLTIDLVGRICLVRRSGQTWAVFLKASRDRSFNIRRSHMPALNVPLDRVTSQRIADKSKMVIGAVGRVKAKSIADSLGVWSLAGYDMTLSGVLDTGDGVQRISKLADLNKIVETVRSGSTFQRGILAEDPRPFGIAARLKIPKGAFVEGVVEDPAPRTFVPGMHKQVLADFIRVRIPFKNAGRGPDAPVEAFRHPQERAVQIHCGRLPT